MVIPILVIASCEERVYEFFEKIKRAQEELQDDPVFKFYFMYASPGQKTVVEENNIYVDVEKGVKKGCTVKTLISLRMLEKLHPDYEFVVRTNLSSILHLDRLHECIKKLRKDVPILSGLVYNNVAFGTLMVWNRMLAQKLITDQSMKMVESTGFQYNDDITLSHLSRAYGAQFDQSMTDKVVETQYSFFYNPPVRNDWILLKRPRNEFSTRYNSDVFSIFPVLEPEIREKLSSELTNTYEYFQTSVLRAIRYMDRTGNTRYIKENIRILLQSLVGMEDGHCELIYYMLKYEFGNVEKVVDDENYSPNKMFLDEIFYYGIVKNRMSKEIYKKLKMSSGTWRDRF